MKLITMVTLSILHLYRNRFCYNGEALNDPKWIYAVKKELEPIEKNNT